MYYYNNYVRLENNIHTLRNNIRFRGIDTSDCVELMLAMQEFETFKEVMSHVKILLKIDKKESECDFDVNSKE